MFSGLVLLRHKDMFLGLQPKCILASVIKLGGIIGKRIWKSRWFPLLTLNKVSQGQFFSHTVNFFLGVKTTQVKSQDEGNDYGITRRFGSN